MSENYWEELYQRGETQWDKGSPSPGLQDYLKDRLKGLSGTVLVPGCGMGYDPVAWATAGFKVTAMDIAPSAVTLARQQALKAGVEVEVIRGNFLEADLGRKFDFLFEHTLFCAIQPDEREAYVEAVRANLKPKGRFVAVHYLIPDEDGPPFGTSREEIVERFSSFLELEEDWVPRSYPNRTNLERMFVWRNDA